MSSTSGNNFGHGASPFTGPNQVLVSGVLGQRTTVDMNSAPVGHVLARTADGLGAVAPSGGLPAPDGSLAAPSIAFASDLDTGFYLPAANTLGASVGGVSAMNITTTNTAVGPGASALGGAELAQVAIGQNATATSTGAIAIGRNAQARNLNIVIGFDAGSTTLTGGANIALGPGALSNQKNAFTNSCIAIGTNAMIGDARTATSNVFSVAVGTSALSSQTSGVQNVAVGVQSGEGCTSGANNVYLGYRAGIAITSGNNNTLIGAGTKASATGIGNTIVGQNAGSTILGNNNTAVGQGALDAAVTAAAAECVAIGANALGGAVNQVAPTSVAVGFNALAAQTVSTGNTAVGHGAGAGITGTGGNENTLIGRAAGSTITTGANNTFVGAGTVGNGGTSNQTLVGAGAFCNGAGCIVVGQGASCGGGSDTIVIGRAAGRNTLGANCVFIGVNAGDGGSIANIENVGIGANALGGTLGGGQNTAVGNSAGSTLGTGTNNAFFGAGTNGSANLNNQTCLGAGTTTTAAGAIAIGRNGAGTSAVGAVADGLAFPTTLAQVAPGLAVQFNAGAMGPTTSSIRYKKDVTLAPTVADTPGQLKSFDRIRVVEFDSKVDGDEKRHLGIIAEELVDLVHPSLIPRDVEGNPAGISYDRLVCLAIQEIQLLRRRVAVLESAPLPELDAYVPIDATTLYDDDQIDDERQTEQRRQYKAQARKLRIDRIVQRIENTPRNETRILNKLNKATRDAVLKAMEDKATAQAEAEAQADAEAEARAKAEADARAEAEAVARAQAEADAQAEAERLRVQAEFEVAAKEAKLNAIARRKMAEGKTDEAGPKMKARIASLVEADRIQAEARATAEAEAKAEAEARAKAEAEADKALEEADEQE